MAATCHGWLRSGDRYLSGPPTALLHGDVFPGSWLSDGTGARVIDPEFCCAGTPEFDYRVMAAHLLLAGQDAPAARVAGQARSEGWVAGLVAACAGVEIMRRLIGVAQLPRLERSLAVKRALLEVSRRLGLKAAAPGRCLIAGAARARRRGGRGLSAPGA